MPNPLLVALLIVAVWVASGRLLPKAVAGHVKSVLKIAATVLAFWLLLAHEVKLDDGSRASAWSLILATFEQIDHTVFWAFALTATAIKMVGMLSSIYRWILVLRGQGIQLPFWHIFGAFMTGRAIGTFLPSTAGLDGYTLYDASRFSGKTVEATAGKFLEKVCGFSGVFMTYLVALPFGISIFGDHAGNVALVTVPVAAGVIGALVLMLFFPGVIQFILEHFPIPAKDRLRGIIMRISNAAAAYRDKKTLVVQILFLSFLVHFTTAAMYYYTSLAISATGATFWQVTFGSAIQILATVVSPFTIAGEGIREAAQMLTLGHLIGAGPAIVSAALGFWAAEAPTMIGFVFWFIRKEDYRPAYCLVDGVQVDYEAAAAAALALETEEEKAARAEREASVVLPSLPRRVMRGAFCGLSVGILAGIVLGVGESIVIAQGGFGAEAQVLWYGPLAWAVVLGGLALLGGAVLGVLPMANDEIDTWVPTLGLVATLVPFGLFVTLFRLRRDVYLEQMPPLGVIALVLGIAGVFTLLVLWQGRNIFGGFGRFFSKPLVMGGLLVAALAIGAGASAALFSGGSGPGSEGSMNAELQSRPNVILVMVDTLRADHLDCYGAKDVKTPNLCRIGRDGGTIYKGFSHASWTKPSTASLLTSTLPSTHGAIAKPSALSEEVVMIPEVLQEAGYTTGGIVSNINLAESFGFAQGYDEYHYLGPDYIAGAAESSSKLILYQLARQVWLKLKPKFTNGIHFADFYQDSEKVNEVAIDWVERNKGDRFFLFLHYMDVHDPYFEHPYNGVGIARVGNDHPDPAMAAEMRRLYKGEIEYLDHNFGVFLDTLKANGVYDDTVIALVSDHGEEFYEHGGWWHGLTLYEEQIHVPMLFKWAKGQAGPAAGATDGIARIIDVAPTLIASAGLTPPPTMHGVDVRAPFAARSDKDQQHFAEEDHEGNVLWALRTATHKMIGANPNNPRGLPEEEFFLIDEDPNEKNPIFSHPLMDTYATYADLQRRAAEGEAVAGGEAEMTFESCEQLRMLGYVDDCSHLK